jgi:predicted nucleic acid-binding protein
MPPALLDTNAVSDLMRHHAKVKAKVANYGGPLVTSVVVWGEIRYGLERLPPGKKRNDLESRARVILSALPAESVTPQVAQEYGRLKAHLESKGLSLQDNDLWIAATAFMPGAILVSRDQTFALAFGLQTEDWTA